MKKRMWKKGMSLALAATMAAALAGCGESGTSSSSGGQTAETDKSTDQNNEQPYEIVMTYPTGGSAPADVDKVEQAVSDYCQEKINCTVKFKTATFWELDSTYTLWASSNEKVDLLYMFNADLGPYVDDGTILNLDEFMPNAENIAKCSETSSFLKGGTYDGSQYAIPVIPTAAGNGKAIYVRTDLLEEIDYEQKDYYSMEDLDDILGKVYANHPDMVMWGRTGVGTGSQFINYADCDTFGVANGSIGALMGFDSTQIVDMYETDEFYDYLKWQKKWYDDGYISKDATTTSESSVDWVRSGRCAGFLIGTNTPGQAETLGVNFGFPMTELMIREDCMLTEAYSSMRWCVSANSENPEKAMEFLDLMYADDGVLVNLLVNGIEGDHYVKLADDSKVIDYPEGVDAMTSPYEAQMNAYGDNRNCYIHTPNTDQYYDDCAAFTERSESNPSIALGYVFDSKPYSSEIAAINNVLAQYLPTLDYGMASDLDSVYKQFISELKNAGIDKVIEGNQQQFDEWRANQK